MYKGDIISSQQVCSLLGVSAPTLRNYRKKYGIREFKIKKKLFFSKTEILYNLYRLLNPIPTRVDLNFLSDIDFEDLKIDSTTYDLRMLGTPDGHGAISLLCHIVGELRKGKIVHFLLSKDCLFLAQMNFFADLKRFINSQLFLDEELLRSLESFSRNDMIKLPITRLGVVGAQNRFVDDLTQSLMKHNYSTDICSYIGWAMGELADNAATHAKVHPSYVYFEQFGEDQNYLQLTIGDVGIGIPDSLRSNKKYSELNDIEAMITAFKPYVSGRSDEEGRGKGLTDVLMIAMECNSYLRVESNRQGAMFSLNQGADNFSLVTPLYKGTGTIISLLFIDGKFDSVDRKMVSDYVDRCLEKL